MIAEDENVARWAAKPITTVQAGSSFAPLVLGPSRVPLVTKDEDAQRAVDLAVLSALVHGKERGLVVGRPAARAVVSSHLPDDRRTLYLDLVLAEEVEKGVEAGIQAAVEKAVDAARADEAEKVEARAVLSVLAARNLTVTEDLRAKILACTSRWPTPKTSSPVRRPSKARASPACSSVGTT